MAANGGGHGTARGAGAVFPDFVRGRGGGRVSGVTALRQLAYADSAGRLTALHKGWGEDPPAAGGWRIDAAGRVFDK